jgi:hypothetical protein
MKRLFLLLALAALLAPSTAFAAPSASVTSPSDGSCIGGTGWPIGGQASGAWSSEFYYDLTVRRNDTGAVITQQHTTQPNIAQPLGSFDTTLAPDGVPLVANLLVHDASGTATASRTFTPIIDRIPPGRPNVDAVYAVSSRQVWVQVSNVRDGGGCSGSIAKYSTWTDGFSLGTQQQTDNNGVVNGPAHEVLSVPVLSGGNTYTIQAVATDTAEVQSSAGLATAIPLPSDYSTVLAGHVRGQGRPISGLYVTATHGAVIRQTITDANGWYRLALPLELNATYSVQYGPGCSFSTVYCASGWVTSTDTVTTSNQIGLILPRHKQMQPGG